MSDEPQGSRTADAVLFDAGGVLVDLDYRYLKRLIEPVCGEVAVELLAEAEAHARRGINNTVGAGGRVGDAWRDYFHVILGRAGVPGDRHEALIDSLWEAHERVGLWTVACDCAKDVVSRLRADGYRLGVVSNAEGQVAKHLTAAGFDGTFETVVDSHLVGVSKPDPAIFRIALERMSLNAARVVFVGDLPEVDVKGATAAGIRPILLDRHDLYETAPAPRIRSLAELPARLADGV